MIKSKYAAAFKDPRWQKKRLKIMERDGFKCRFCGNDEETLNVHHLRYSGGKMPWDYADKFLVTLCESCHEKVEAERSEIALSLVDMNAYSCHRSLRRFIAKNGRELSCIFSSLIVSIGYAYERGEMDHVRDICSRCHGIDEKWKHPTPETNPAWDNPLPPEEYVKNARNFFAAMREAAK